jgi:hypothetical protein
LEAEQNIPDVRSQRPENRTQNAATPKNTVPDTIFSRLENTVLDGALEPYAFQEPDGAAQKNTEQRKKLPLLGATIIHPCKASEAFAGAE